MAPFAHDLSHLDAAQTHGEMCAPRAVRARDAALARALPTSAAPGMVTTRPLGGSRAAPDPVEDPRWSLVGGRYAPRGLIGRGGMATVFEATDLVTGAAVALKRPHRQAQGASEASRFSLAEAGVMARISHPNVARVLDAGVDPEGWWFVMEHLHGESLHDHLARLGALSPRRVAAVLLPTLAAVEAVHGAGVAHGDIKPANVILARRHGVVVPTLIDFGVSSTVVAHGDPMVALGTPTFMAPERILRHAPPDVASDVWSLGALLYTCAVGALPFHGAALTDLVLEVLTHETPDTEGVAPSVRAVIDRAMHPDPHARFASTREMTAALRAALRDADAG